MAKPRQLQFKIQNKLNFYIVGGTKDQPLFQQLNDENFNNGSKRFN
jgi:hypothetical protein